MKRRQLAAQCIEIFLYQERQVVAKALNPLCPLSTLLSHTGTKATACKIRGRFISVETEVLLANLITLSQTKHKLCPSRADALARVKIRSPQGVGVCHRIVTSGSEGI